MKELEASTQIDLAKGYTEELIFPKERTFRRDSTPDGVTQSATEAAAQISMDDVTEQPVWSDSGAGAPATEEVSV